MVGVYSHTWLPNDHFTKKMVIEYPLSADHVAVSEINTNLKPLRADNDF